jgi:predicted dehydrogenase
VGKSDAPRVALVGCGALSTRAYLPTLRAAHRAGQCRFVALCDLDAERLTARAREFGVRQTYTDVQALVESETLDGIFVVVSVDATAAVAGMTLRRGLTTYLEKPPGRNAAECRQLIRAAEEGGGVPHQVAFNRRYAPPLSLLREEMLKFGPIHSASGVMFRVKRLEPSFITGTAIHSLDGLRFLAGDVVRVSARRKRLPGYETESYILDIEYASGGFGTLEVLPDVGVSVERYAAHGLSTTGFAQIQGPGSCLDQPGAAQLYHRGRPVPLPNPFGRPHKVSLPEACGFRAEILAFLDCLRTGRPPWPTLADSLQSLEVCETIGKGKTFTAASS